MDVATFVSITWPEPTDKACTPTEQYRHGVMRPIAHLVSTAVSVVARPELVIGYHLGGHDGEFDMWLCHWITQVTVGAVRDWTCLHSWIDAHFRVAAS